MKRRIALLLVICLLASTVPAATAGGAVDDGILDNGIELADVGEQDMTGPSESDGIELEVDDFLDEPGDILPEDDMPELELGDALDLPEGETLHLESEAQGDASQANDDSSDFTIENGVLTKYNGAGGDVVIPDGVTRIGERAFAFTEKITSVTVPEGVISIDDKAFQECGKLESIALPDSLVSIGEEAFEGCWTLKAIVIPKGVTTIGKEAFWGCFALTSVSIIGNVKDIGYRTFKDCALTNVILPKSLTNLGEEAFSDCYLLEHIEIPENVSNIGKKAFTVCCRLTSVTIPGRVKAVGENAFSFCWALKNVVISDGVKKIEAKAFYQCSTLESITIPASVGKIGMDVFKDCNLVKIKGYTGSCAETYAKDNGLAFESIGVIPATPTPVPTKTPAPTATPKISIPKTLTLGVKETYALDAAGASFKSSNKSVAAVDKKGVVTAKKAGSATVTVTFSGKKVGTCKVTVVKAPTSISFAEKAVTLGVKETLALKPTITKGSHASYTWSVKNKKIATVDKDGVVTGKKAGKTTVTVKTHNGKKATVTVTVQKAPTKVSLPKKAVTLGVKEALTLTPKIAKGAHTSFTWTVEDSKIATVTKNGKVTGKKAGKTTVTVKTHNGKKATVAVTVMKAPTKVSLEAKTMALGVKESVKLKPEIARDAHTSYTWTVKNKKIATVTKDGKLTGKKAGKTTVTVKTHNGKKATMTVNVMAAPGSITLSGKSRKLTVGDAIMLMPTLPKKTASRITWSSSKKSVASVDASGVVRALKKGTAKITAKTFNGKKAVCTVTVGEGASYLAFDAEALSVGVKEKVKLKPQVNEGAKVKYTWTTGNKKVATVSKKGVVTGVKAGTTDITVKTQNGLTATVKVTVLAAPSKVTLNKGKATLPENQTLQLKATLPKKTATQIKWSSSDKKVASVDENGLVTAVAVGKATITAQTFNGKKATCVVTVREESVEDHIQEIIDAVDVSSDGNVELSSLKANYISCEGYEDVEGMPEFVERYNGLVSDLNAEIDDYQVCLEELVDVLGQIDDVMGRTRIKATDSGIQFDNDVVSFSIITDVSNASAKNVRNGIKIKLNGSYALLVQNGKGLEANKERTSLSDWINVANSWLVGIGNLIEIFADKFEPLEKKAKSIVDKEKERVNSLLEKEKSAQDDVNEAKKALRKAKGDKQKGIRQRALKKAQEALKAVRSVKPAAEKALKDAVAHAGWVSNFVKAFKALVHSQADAFAALTYDAYLGHHVDTAFFHGHPANRRESYDEVRYEYCKKLDAAISEADKSFMEDISFHCANVTIDLISLTPEGWGKEMCIKLIGEELTEKLIAKLSKITCSKLAKSEWVKKLKELTGFTAITAAQIKYGPELRAKVEEGHDKVVHYEDILHGVIRGNIIGKVIDANTKKPIEDVLVQMGTDGFTGYNTKASADAKTKSNGTFVISAIYGDYSGEYSLWLYKEGYVTTFGEAVVDEERDEANILVEMTLIGIPIDEEHFPDVKFRNKVKEFDLDNNGYLSDEEIAKITTVAVDDFSIESLEGIKYFTAMQKLSCARNALKELDIMECAALQEVDCSENDLTSLNVAGHQTLVKLNCANNPMDMLDVSQCPKLREVYCSSSEASGGKLKRLNASQSVSLNTLNLAHNQLTLLDVGGCTALQTLDCSDNKLTSVTTDGVSSSGVLSLNGCTALQALRINNNQLTSLSVKGCTALQKLFCNSNRLTGLDVGGMAKLTDLNCGDNQLTSLNVTGCAALEVLNCAVNKLTGLNINGLTKLADLNCSGNQLTSLNVNGCAALRVLDCSSNQLTKLDISACAALQELYCTSNQIETLDYFTIKRLEVAQYDDGTWLAVLFGRYEQDNVSSNGAEPIEWIVLEDKGDTLTLISRYGLDCKPYHTERKEITWQNCSLRAWLNGAFLSSAFTSAEQAKLQTVTVKAEDDPYFVEEAGNDTQDKVYLLSISEADNLFASNADRQCKATAYAKARGAYTSTRTRYYDNCWWWLRYPGAYAISAGGVLFLDDVYDLSYYIDGDDAAVRPVVCLRLS